MDVSITEKNGIPIVTARGHIHGSNVSDFHAPFDELLQQGKTKIVLELSGVDFLSSAGVRVIISVKNRAQANNGMLKLANLSNAATGTLMLVGIEMFDIYDTIDLAVGSF